VHNLLLFALNSLRFWDLNSTPSGFYVDEAAGATQVICLSQTGIDLYGEHYPLFSAGAADALYTPLYLYGQVLWTEIARFSPAGFRSYIAAVTCLTVFFLYQWAKNVGGKRFAFYVAFAASVSPWAFSLSRVAWDPPVAVLFLVMGLWASSLKKFWWIAGIFFAGAAYSYSPIRMSAVLILFFLPAFFLRQKLVTFATMAFAGIPLLLEMSKPYFLERAKFLTIWGQHGLNPYAYFSSWELVEVFYQNFLNHLSVKFLVLHGDGNLRHVNSGFGVLSYLDLLALSGLAFFISLTIWRKMIKEEGIFETWQRVALLVGLLGFIANIIPASLTVNTPHALRSIGAWPFIAILSGLGLMLLERFVLPRRVMWASLVIGLSFFAVYLHHYFGQYSKDSASAFTGDGSPIYQAYTRLISEGLSCAQLDRELKPPKLFAPLRPRPNEMIDFSGKGYGGNYLGQGWHEQEPWGRWSANPWAELIFFPPIGNPEKLIINAKVLIAPNHPSLKFEAWSGDKKLGQYELRSNQTNQFEIPISDKLIKDNLLIIRLRILNPISPVDAKLSADDHRSLGLGIQSAVFEENLKDN
jgi:hypothetical protein